MNDSQIIFTLKLHHHTMCLWVRTKPYSADGVAQSFLDFPLPYPISCTLFQWPRLSPPEIVTEMKEASLGQLEKRQVGNRFGQFLSFLWLQEGSRSLDKHNDVAQSGGGRLSSRRGSEGWSPWVGADGEELQLRAWEGLSPLVWQARLGVLLES